MKKFAFYICFSATLLLVKISLAADLNDLPLSKHKVDGMTFTKVIYKGEEADAWPMWMNFDEAKSFCNSAGGILPSARQFASLAMQLGAKGLKDTAYPNAPVFPQYPLPPDSMAKPVEREIKKMNEEGYIQVHARHVSNGKPSSALAIDFYMSAKGLEWPYTPGDNWKDDGAYWTYSGEGPSVYSQRFFTADGSFGYTPWIKKELVRCLVP